MSEKDGVRQIPGRNQNRRPLKNRSADARGVSRRRKRQKSRSLGIAPVLYCLTWGFKIEPVILILFIDDFYKLGNLIYLSSVAALPVMPQCIPLHYRKTSCNTTRYLSRGYLMFTATFIIYQTHHLKRAIIEVSLRPLIIKLKERGSYEIPAYSCSF